MIKETLKKLVEDALKVAYPDIAPPITFEHPGDLSHGDYSTNVALVCAKELKMSPLALAVQLVESINATKTAEITKVEVAGPGFINFYLSADFFRKSIAEITEQKEEFGKGVLLKNKTVVVEYTNPNPFKQFHIGHLMDNAVGESIAGIVEWNGANTKRVCYQGDVGRHVALCLYGIRLLSEPFPSEEVPLADRIAYLGKAYAAGATKAKEDGSIEESIRELNKHIYDKDDAEVNELYDKGREWSLEYFEELYQKLGTHFDYYFFESNAAPIGLETVLRNVENGIFEKSEGAIIFAGEKYGLHTRVFVNKEGIPTYEAKELGQARLKADTFSYDQSIIVSANEISDYFKVLLKVIELVFPDLANKTRHVAHGILKLPSGKMSSRTGDVITAASLIGDIEERVATKMADRDLSAEAKKEIIEKVAIAAIKYSILKQSPGKDIIFDMEASLSFEGDSGPYLQYSYVRARSVLAKVSSDQKRVGSDIGASSTESSEKINLEKLLYRFPEIIEQAMVDMAPQQIATYLIHIAAAFNSFYATTKILDGGEETTYRIALTEAFSIVMKNGLTILGIPVPEHM